MHKLTVVVAIVLSVSITERTLAGVNTGLLGVDINSIAIDSASRTRASGVLRNLGAISKEDPLHVSSLQKRAVALRADLPLQTRGAREIELYRNTAPAVVLIATNEGFGSGSVLNKDGAIITNWHVVQGYSEVGVIFKPQIEGQKIKKTDIFRGVVLKIDEVADLALVQVKSPPKNLPSIALGELADLQVGADVHAIGHPTGEVWTYTKGIVSQLRKGYQWETEEQKKHRADVIQTQTPINPGNSGGPLLSDSGRLVGVNSFKAEGEALNFSVSVDEVKRFLGTTKNRYADKITKAPSTQRNVGKCEPREMGEKRDKIKRETLTALDLNCDGIADGIMTVPDDTSKPIDFSFDKNGDGKFDIIYADTDRDGKIDISVYDTNYDGSPDLIGYHQNGEVEPYRFETVVASR